MVLSRCSSSAVQGVFVLPLFLPVGVGSGAGAGWRAGGWWPSASTPLEGGGGAIVVNGAAWSDARRFRGLDGDTEPGGIGGPLSNGPGPGKVGGWPNGRAGELLATDVLIRLDVGGFLLWVIRRSISELFNLDTLACLVGTPFQSAWPEYLSFTFASWFEVPVNEWEMRDRVRVRVQSK